MSNENFFSPLFLVLFEKEKIHLETQIHRQIDKKVAIFNFYITKKKGLLNGKNSTAMNERNYVQLCYMHRQYNYVTFSYISMRNHIGIKIFKICNFLCLQIAFSHIIKLRWFTIGKWRQFHSFAVLFWQFCQKKVSFSLWTQFIFYTPIYIQQY